MDGYVHFFPFFSAFETTGTAAFLNPPPATGTCEFCHRRYALTLSLSRDHTNPQVQATLADMQRAGDLASRLAEMLYRAEVKPVAEGNSTDAPPTS